MWQPIATAPKDNPNRQVLLWDPKVGLGTGAVFVGTFVRDWWRAYPAWTQVEPTHWMPVPLPPDAENDEREFRERDNGTTGPRRPTVRKAAMITRESKGLKRYRSYMGSQMDCGGDGCGYCRVCRRLNFLEWVGQVAPRDIPHSVSPNFDVDTYIRRNYPHAI